MSVAAYSNIGLKNIKSFLFTCVFLVGIIYSFTLLELKGDVLFNTLKNLQVREFWKEDPDSFDFDTLTGAQLLMEYLKWPNETACERVGYYC